MANVNLKYSSRYPSFWFGFFFLIELILDLKQTPQKVNFNKSTVSINNGKLTINIFKRQITRIITLLSDEQSLETVN